MSSLHCIDQLKGEVVDRLCLSTDSDDSVLLLNPQNVAEEAARRLREATGELGVSIYTLRPAANNDQIAVPALSDCEAVDYAGFLELATQCSRQILWR